MKVFFRDKMGIDPNRKIEYTEPQYIYLDGITGYLIIDIKGNFIFLYNHIQLEDVEYKSLTNRFELVIIKQS